jgi:hypothetical protein
MKIANSGLVSLHRLTGYLIKKTETNMGKNTELQAPQPTRSLEAFEILVGEWTMVGTHPQLPSAVHGHSTFEWLRKGMLLVWQFNWDQGQGIPNAYNVIGHDDTVEPCSMLYTDERGVARIYQMSLVDGTWKMWRESPDFSQRMTGTFSDNNNLINWVGELSHDGSNWEPDLNVTFTKKR